MAASLIDGLWRRWRLQTSNWGRRMAHGSTAAHLRSSRTAADRTGTGNTGPRRLARAQRATEDRFTGARLARKRTSGARLSRRGRRSRTALLNSRQKFGVGRNYGSSHRLSGHRGPRTTGARLLRTCRSGRAAGLLLRSTRLRRPRGKRSLRTSDGRTRHPRCSRRSRRTGQGWRGGAWLQRRSVRHFRRQRLPRAGYHLARLWIE